MAEPFKVRCDYQVRYKCDCGWKSQVFLYDPRSVTDCVMPPDVYYAARDHDPKCRLMFGFVKPLDDSDRIEALEYDVFEPIQNVIERAEAAVEAEERVDG
jgi:hypothetical protein